MTALHICDSPTDILRQPGGEGPDSPYVTSAGIPLDFGGVCRRREAY